MRRLFTSVWPSLLSSALAQGNAANGATLYVQKINIGGAQLSCQDCHGFAGTFRDARFAGANEATILGAITSAINGNAGQVPHIPRGQRNSAPT